MWQLWLLMSMPTEEGMFSTSHRDTSSNLACFSPVAVRSGCIHPVRSSPGKNVQKIIIHLVVMVPEWFNKGLKDLQPETRRTAVFLLPLSVYLEASIIRVLSAILHWLWCTSIAAGATSSSSSKREMHQSTNDVVKGQESHVALYL